MKDYKIAFEYSEKMEHMKWVKEIPYINFKKEWAVQVSPPFSGAVVRFRVKYNNAEVSVYLDCYDRLGYYGSPYWEVYPHNDDVFRCDMLDTESLLKAIEESILEQTLR